MTILGTIITTVVMTWCSKQNTVQAGDTIEISYTATLPDGSTYKTNEGGETLRFVVGSGEVIAGVEEGVIDMKLNATDTIKITAEKAYGAEYNKMKVQKIAKNIFETSKLNPVKGEKIQLGNETGLVIGYETDQKWNEYVLFDINPPYTYETLTYKITIKKLEKKALK